MQPFHWAHVSDMEFLQLSEHGSLKDILDYWDIHLSDEACDLLQTMLRRNPRERLTLAQVMKHHWVRNIKFDEKAASTVKKSASDDNKVGKSSWFKKKREKCISKSSNR